MSRRKANTPVSTREQIVDAAITMVDPPDGVRRSDARTLRHHVPDRFALQDLTFDAVTGEGDVTADNPALDVVQERPVHARDALRSARAGCVTRRDRRESCCRLTPARSTVPTSARESGGGDRG